MHLWVKPDKYSTYVGDRLMMSKKKTIDLEGHINGVIIFFNGQVTWQKYVKNSKHLRGQNSGEKKFGQRKATNSRYRKVRGS